METIVFKKSSNAALPACADFLVLLCPISTFNDAILADIPTGTNHMSAGLSFCSRLRTVASNYGAPEAGDRSALLDPDRTDILPLFSNRLLGSIGIDLVSRHAFPEESQVFFN
jgi:hypothetical protein